MMNREQDSRSDLERLRATNETLQTINALTDETTDAIRRHPTAGTLSGQAVTSREVIVCPNMQTEPSVSESIRETARR